MSNELTLSTSAQIPALAAAGEFGGALILNYANR
jgi:hypothetical protein